MGSLKKFFLYIVMAIFILMSFYFICRLYTVFIDGYSLKEMDWNQDGSTSLSEIIDSSDIGKRVIQVNGELCAEYFAYKDGLPVKTVCNH